MVICAGFEFKNDCIELYDSENRTTTKILIERIKNTRSVDKMFQILPKNIDFFCIMLEYIIGNNFRKIFIQSAKKHGIKNVSIICVRQALLYGAINCLQNVSTNGDALWIFLVQETLIFVFIWAFGENNKWNFRFSCFLKRKHNDLINDLRELKAKINKNAETPFIFVNYKLDDAYKNECVPIFKTVFNTHKNVISDTSTIWSKWALFYARHLSGEKSFSQYSGDACFGRTVEIKHNNATICHMLGHKILPNFTTVPVVLRKGDNLELYEDRKLCKNVQCSFTNQSIFLTLKCDENGIFAIHSDIAVVSIGSCNVSILSSILSGPESFLATVGFDGRIPVVDGSKTSNCVSAIIDLLGQARVPTLYKQISKIFYHQGYPELYFSFNDDTVYMNTESLLAELLKEAVKRINFAAETYILTFPRHFNEAQKEAYLKATQYAKLPKVEFIDEMTALAYGYKQVLKINEEFTFAIILSSTFNVTVGIFKADDIQANDGFSLTIEVDEIELCKNAFYDSIIENWNDFDDCTEKCAFYKHIQKIYNNCLTILSTKSSLNTILINEKYLTDLIHFYYPELPVGFIVNVPEVAAIGAYQIYEN